MNFLGSADIPSPVFPEGPELDYPHRIEGTCYVDDSPVSRRVEIRRRVVGDYIASTVTDADGVFQFRHLPIQTLATPYVVVAYDDSVSGFVNALIFDRVYQVDDLGNPPQS